MKEQSDGFHDAEHGVFKTVLQADLSGMIDLQILAHAAVWDPLFAKRFGVASARSP
jgi:hypothetical protein